MCGMEMRHWTVIERRLETAEDAPKRVHCLKLMGEAAWTPGDWFLVQPHNPDQVVDDVLVALGLTGEESITLRRHGVLKAREALTHYLEITQLDPAVLNRLQRQHGIGDWPDRAAMAAYAQGRNLADLLCDWPQARRLGLVLLSLLSPLAPRYYSIASSPLVTPEEVHLLFREVGRTVCGRYHPGAATHMLAHLSPGDIVRGRVQVNKHFRLPESPETPIVMIGSGVGLAPFLGFMAHRIAMGATGEHWLFFGETHRDKTFLCQQQLMRWEAAGHLSLITAFSRDQAQKVYVQHRLKAHGKALVRLVNAGAHIYVCGDKRNMAPAVLETLSQIVGEAGMAALKAEKRLKMDVF